LYYAPTLKNAERYSPKTNHGYSKPIQTRITYTPEEIVKLKKADRVARTLYMLGNTGGTDAYANGKTVYNIRMALRARFAPVDGMG
jgi:hypothetical protein